jgi:predicted extracellular nuclease
MSLRGPALDNNVGANWCEASTPYGAGDLGTPGGENDCVTEAVEVIINEIMQNPSAVSDSNGEWFEVYNPTASPIDIEGWTIEDNDFDSHLIANGGPLIIPAGGYLVLANNADSASNGGVNVDYQYSGIFLSNSGDELVLLDTALTEIDRVEWDNGATFPDPNGASMSLIDPTLDNNVGANWCEAITPFGDGDLGTPGTSNQCTGIIINEIMQNPSAVPDNDGEWFEVYNFTASPVDINGWTIADNDFDSHVINNGGSLIVPAGGYLVLAANADFSTNGGVVADYEYGSGFFLSNGADELILFDTTLAEVDRVEWDNGATFPDPNGASMALIDPLLDNNVGANWCTASTPYGAGDLGTPGAVNDCPIAPPFGACADPATFIHDVQGPGLASPIVGEVGVVIEGVVVGDYQDTGTGLGGFFVQEEDFDIDSDPMTSEGVFVRDNGFGVPVAKGDVVRVQGDVEEFFTLTRLNNVINVAVCSSGASVSASNIALPVAAVLDFEFTEGMLVSFPGTLYVSGNFNQGRFGEVDLSVVAPLDNPTNVVAPGGPALTLSDLNSRSRIQLDDGSNVQNPLPLPPYIGGGGTLRTGDTVEDLVAVMSFAFGAYELHPVGDISFTRVNARSAPPDVGGAVTVASFNVLNYFTTLDDSGSICGPMSDQGCRGADNAAEFALQRDKLISAISKLDADVVGLIELENHPHDVPIADLVNGINAVAGAGTYEFIETGPIGTDAIRVGLIYQPAVVTPVGPFEVLDSSVDPLFDDTKNRPVLAQSFVENSENGVVFTVAVNHLKSKGSSCDDVGDPNMNDGQGNCNGVRTAAAAAQADWLATDPTGSGSPDFLIIGDLNAYSQEDPVTTIESSGYVDLVEALVGTGFAAGAYSFNFFAESGSLDHALATSAMVPAVTGAGIWHINADEPRALDYNDFNQPALQKPDEFRSSDHDPVLVGLFGDEDNDGVFDQLDNCSGTVIPESVPTTGQLNPNHWALTDGDSLFDTVVKGKGKGPKRSYSIFDTAGCSCAQIIEAQGLGDGHSKYGCTIGVMDNWVELVTP